MVAYQPISILEITMLKTIFVIIATTSCLFNSSFSMQKQPAKKRKSSSQQKLFITVKELEKIGSLMRQFNSDEILASMGLVKLSQTQSNKKWIMPKKMDSAILSNKNKK